VAGVRNSPRFCPPELLDRPAREDLWTILMTYAPDGTWAEFGVAGGTSARYWIARMPADTQLHLFDSFNGLPEEWDFNGDINHVGRYAQPSIPVFDDPRVHVHAGMFEDTLPEANLGVLDFVHIDCDIYSSTRTVFDHIQVKEGTIILFDEYWGYADYMNHERKAFLEWSERTGYELEWLAKNRTQAAGIIKG
jgi:predicted O-methyltransferase YrrM